MNSTHESTRFPPGVYTSAEERANLWTHALGLALSVVGTASLAVVLTRQADAGRTIGCLVYAATLVAVYAMSTLSHCPFPPHRRRLFRSLDQGVIYLLIVGTYTPFSTAFLHGPGWSLFLAAMWTIAAAGFVSKVFFAHRVEAVSIWLYVALGWMPIVAAPWLMELVPAAALRRMLAGGLCYTLGTVFLLFDRRVLHFHAVWHLCVIAGSALHFAAIWQYVAAGAD